MRRVIVLGGRAAMVSLSTILLGPTAAAAEPAVQFIEDAPVVFTAEEGGVTPSVVTVAVVMTGGPDATAVLEVVGEAEPWLSIEPNEYTAPSNGRVEFQLTISAEAQPAEGVLIATTSEGAVARRAIKIATPEAASAPLPSTLTFNGWHWVPFLHFNARIRAKSDAAFVGHTDGEVGVVSSANALGSSLAELLLRLSKAGLPGSPLALTYAVDQSVAGEVTANADAVFLIEGAEPEYAVAADAESATLLEQADIQPVSAGDVEPDKPVLVVAATPKTDENYSMVGITSRAAPPEDLRMLLPGESAAQLLARYQDTEKWFSILAGVFTVLGGMAAVYFPSPTFGSLGDYASVILWGTAFGKGADAVAKFLAFR